MKNTRNFSNIGKEKKHVVISLHTKEFHEYIITARIFM
jgi:hypothetical protein